MLAGFSLTLGNPKTIVFYLALLPTLIPLERMTVLGFVELVATVTVLLTLIGSAYGAAGRERAGPVPQPDGAETHEPHGRHDHGRGGGGHRGALKRFPT